MKILTLSSILIIAIVCRVVYSLHGLGVHPDERHMIMVTMKLGMDNLNPGSFAYGSLPFYLLWLISSALSTFSDYFVSYDGRFLVGRSIAAAFGTTTVFLTFLLAKSLYSRVWLALLAAALLGLNVFHIQLSRFFTVDVILTALAVATIFGCLKIASKGSLFSYSFTGLMIGLAIATKLSGASLVLPFGMALILGCYNRKDWYSARLFLGLTFFAVSLALTLLIAQPYMFLDWTTYLANNQEQMRMVSGEWRPPYTVQYENTLAYFYPLKQMFFYTMGPPLFITAIGGLIFVIFMQFKKPDQKLLIILSWVVPYFLLIASYQVKFPRYLLPLYPFLFIFGAYFLFEIAASLSRIRNPYMRWFPAAVVLIWSGFYALAFVNIYAEEHAYKSASRWIYANVEPGSKLLGVHWDDKLPLYLPSQFPQQYEYSGAEWELPLYERESAERIEALSKKLEAGDYIVFPTARTYGSLLMVPDEFPLTANLLRLLFSDNLGYELIKTVKRRPHIGSAIFDDDLADESFTVYDHPKVSIFKNVKSLSASEIKDKIYNPSQFEPLPGRNQIMRRDAGERVGTSGSLEATPTPYFFQLLLWLFCLKLFSFSMIPLLKLALPRAPDKGYSLSYSTGFLIFGFSVWFLPSLGIAPFNTTTSWTVLTLMILCAMALTFKLRPGQINQFTAVNKKILPVELLFFGGFAFFLLLRAFNPEIFWGEKPMNFSFLNYFIRLDYPPPHDPWAAGQQMSYYYVGSYFFAAMHKLTGISPAVGFSLSIATIGALLLCSVYSIILSLLKRPWVAFFGTLAVVLLSNLEVVNLVLFSERKINFDLFWASARLFTSPAITEYPIWTFLFGDLHAHMIALPFLVATLALFIPLLDSQDRVLTKQNVIHRGLLGLCCGSLFAINSWDAVSTALVLFLVLLYPIVSLADRKSFLHEASLSLWNGLLITFFALLAASPFILSSHSGSNIHYGFVRDGFDTTSQLVRHLGLWLAIIFSGLLIIGYGSFRAGKSCGVRFGVALLWAAIPFLIAGTSTLLYSAPVPWGIMFISASLLALSSFAFWHRNTLVQFRIMGIFITGAGLLITLTQIFFVMDRMNTIFKFYNVIWLLLAISAVSGLPYLVSVLSRPGNSFRRVTGWGITLFIGGLVAISALGTIINIYIMTDFQRVPGPRPTLDGQAYLVDQNKDEAALIFWMNQNIKGTPVVLEAQGRSYGPFTRITMHTGLPTVLGWEHHVSQRGTTRSEISRRRDAIVEIYSTEDVDRALELLGDYGVQYIVVSNLEVEEYPFEGLWKFEESDSFQLIFGSGESRLFKVEP